ncbi:arfGTPase-activating protein [Naegleria gruberi]|uniref:ArfGTPase-activating protein n=1 Tax=Naegleria gruberi TaxID=5762 RepID=D2W0A7_NAEGR|nr:arfGTPase-activating protein [Naegleria gruberi]EFC37541.1 arfGTPase-activating protein [Naegleria gruberi]|eukprot:XP_002670285.1 arfGTPase-activating protein [Naegleria gruberi strain NEG-M]
MLKRIQSGSNYDSSPTSPTYHSSGGSNSSSSSSASSSSNNRDKQQEQFRKILSVLIKKPGNGECADCTEARPVWCSATFGTFICLRCAGIHRSLGSHISFVRSAEMDKWDEKHVKIMQLMGNERAKQYFECNLPEDKKKPARIDSTQVVEQYIKEKYVNLKYVPKKEDGKKMTFKEFLELAKQHDEPNEDDTLPQQKKKKEKSEKSEKSEKTTVKKKKVKKVVADESSSSPTTTTSKKKTETTVEDLIGITTLSPSSTQNLTSIDDFMSDIISPITPSMNEIPTPVSATDNTLLGFLSDKFSLIDLGSSNAGTTKGSASPTVSPNVVSNNTSSTITETTAPKKKTVKKSVKPIKTKKQESSDNEDEDSADEYDAIFQKTTTQKAASQDEKKNAILDLWGH